MNYRRIFTENEYKEIQRLIDEENYSVLQLAERFNMAFSTMRSRVITDERIKYTHTIDRENIVKRAIHCNVIDTEHLQKYAPQYTLTEYHRIFYPQLTKEAVRQTALKRGIVFKKNIRIPLPDEVIKKASKMCKYMDFKEFYFTEYDGRYPKQYKYDPLKHKLRTLGIVFPETNPKWTQREIQILKEYYAKGGYKLCKEHGLKHTVKQIEQKVYDEGIEKYKPRWKQEDISILKEYYAKGGIKAVRENGINEKLTDKQIYHKAYNMGIIQKRKKIHMKAYTVSDKASWENMMTVVFAENSGKAKALALCTDACMDAEFINIQCRRSPQFDKYFSKGKVEMEWDNAKDRIALVKAGWNCVDEHECDFKNCPAVKYCERYKTEREYE